MKPAALMVLFSVLASSYLHAEEVEEAPREAATRQPAVQKKYGAVPAPVDPVRKTLQWLISVQKENGSWEDSPAHTGLALLCFLAHGETPLSVDFGPSVQKSMQWLIDNSPERGVWGGNDQKAVYHHAIGTFAVAEAYAMTQIPSLKEPMEKLTATIIAGQQPRGGWDYRYAKGKRWDLSVTAWQARALKAAYVAGSENPTLPNTIQRTIIFLKSTYQDGRFGYTRRGLDPSGNLTGLGAYTLANLGESYSKAFIEATDWVLANRLSTYVDAREHWEKNRRNLYGWHFDTQVMFQRQGSHWKDWRRQYEKTLFEHQHPDGYWTFDTPIMGEIGGPTTRGKIISTCLAVQQVEIYYAYLPTFEADKIGLGGDNDGLTIE
jgi:hypothetical protein